MATPRLTYCGNVHPAVDLGAWLAQTRMHTAPIAARARAAGREFGIGGWWPNAMVEEIVQDGDARARLAAGLDQLGLTLWTLNVFPYGNFHDAVVKTSVYAPDWSTEERLLYSRRCADLAARLVPPGSVVPLSTLPLGYRRKGEAADLRCMARNLVRCASAFAAIEAATGVVCVLALEPEPDCLLETAAATADFFDQWVFAAGAFPTVSEASLRRHLGVCVDLCHLAVVGEDPVSALAMLRARGIGVAKIQVSAGLEVRAPKGLDRLLQFAEPRYLHQTVAENGLRSLDLDEVRQLYSRYAAAGRVRSHYHVPVFWDEPGDFGSTQSEVARVLRTLAASREPLPLLEVETYTWGVLGDFAGQSPLADRIARELEWVAAQLDLRPIGC